MLFKVDVSNSRRPYCHEVDIHVSEGFLEDDIPIVVKVYLYDSKHNLLDRRDLAISHFMDLFCVEVVKV